LLARLLEIAVAVEKMPWLTSHWQTASQSRSCGHTED